LLQELQREKQDPNKREERKSRQAGSRGIISLENQGLAAHNMPSKLSAVEQFHLSATGYDRLR
jgi:hypothetical protein